MEKTLKNPQFVEDYFSNMNEISKKIALDISEISSVTHRNASRIWNELNEEEQADLINETIIQPEITLLYFDFSNSTESLKNLIDSEKSDEKQVNLFDGMNLSTYQIVKTGRKIVHDENTGKYRDPHSGPFNVKTKSQINLNIFDVEKKKVSSGTKPKSIKYEAKNKEPVKEVITDKVTENRSIINNLIFSDLSLENGYSTTPDTNDKTQLFAKDSVSRDHSSFNSSEDDKNEFQCLLNSAKVDFDFLNNW